MSRLSYSSLSDLKSPFLHWLSLWGYFPLLFSLYLIFKCNVFRFMLAEFQMNHMLKSQIQESHLKLFSRFTATFFQIYLPNILPLLLFWKSSFNFNSYRSPSHPTARSLSLIFQRHFDPYFRSNSSMEVNVRCMSVSRRVKTALDEFSKWFTIR